MFKNTDRRSKLDNSQFTLTTTIDLPSTLLEMTRPVDPGYSMIILSASNAVGRHSSELSNNYKLSEDYKLSGEN